jgi:hypothetical protein
MTHLNSAPAAQIPGVSFVAKARRRNPKLSGNHFESDALHPRILTKEASNMEPMKPMKPMSGGEQWWPNDLGQPSSTGSQNSMRYAFFSKARRLLIEKDNNLTTYDSGDHQISGVQQSGGGSDPVFTSQNGSLNLGELRIIS